ncbi:MAG: PilZ domain-containing protein [Steroidobacteraceae bacterium]|jgi:hypothetical protein
MPESVLGDGLIFEDALPFAWEPGLAEGESNLARLNADNHQLLTADSTLDEVRVPDALKDESAALVHELQRLDYKLNILLRLAADLAMRRHGLPEARTVRFSSSGFEWMGEDAPETGSTGVLMLYVNPSLPQPLKLPAIVVGTSHNDMRTARLQFTGLSESVVELIEKMIFRHHRRRVAGARLSPNRRG